MGLILGYKSMYVIPHYNKKFLIKLFCKFCNFAIMYILHVILWAVNSYFTVFKMFTLACLISSGEMSFNIPMMLGHYGIGTFLRNRPRKVDSWSWFSGMFGFKVEKTVRAGEGGGGVL